MPKNSTAFGKAPRRWAGNRNVLGFERAHGPGYVRGILAWYYKQIASGVEGMRRRIQWPFSPGFASNLLVWGPG